MDRSLSLVIITWKKIILHLARKPNIGKKDCPKIKNNKKEPRSEANVSHANSTDSDSSVYSLLITPTICYSYASE